MLGTSLLAALLLGCSSAPTAPSSAGPASVREERPRLPDVAGLPDPVASVLLAENGYLTRGQDAYEVWVCSVPATTTNDAYQPGGIRLGLDPDDLAGILTDHVTDYFAELSSAAYTPSFVSGGRIELTEAEGPNECFSRATARAETTPGVIAIATAEHREGTSGGFGTSGERCAADRAWPCAASETGRGVYLGASDFHPDWGAVPALDLLEHEIGHVLGWPHSGRLDSAYASSIDVMSNSAAPRDVDSAQRNGQGTLAVNRLAAGWIPLDDVAIVPDRGAELSLRASQGDSGTRIGIVPLDSEQFLTIEYFPAIGAQAHLPESGVTITRVSTSTSSCDTADTDRICRTQESVTGVAPFTDLLSDDGDRWDGLGWSVTVESISPDAATVRVRSVPEE